MWLPFTTTLLEPVLDTEPAEVTNDLVVLEEATVPTFSFRPSLTWAGRASKGLRGYAGKPFHPPLTDVPVTAYLFAAVFDVLSLLLYDGHERLGTELTRAATWVLLGGAVVSLLTALTGWADWHYSTEKGTQARRTVNAHATIMISVTVLVLLNLAVRLGADADHSSAVNAVLSVAAAALVTVGSTYGGSLVFDYGFNVETSGDHPVWHVSDTDVLPGRH
jgi:uncharacterized membrane protein